MTRFAISCTADPVQPLAAHRQDPVTASVAGIAAEAAVTSDITAALANGTISGDPTALGLVTAIQTDFAILIAALASGTTSPVVLSFDGAAVVTKNQLRLCIAAILKTIDGSNDLT